MGATTGQFVFDVTETTKITDAGKPAIFAEGWEPVFIYTGLETLAVLCFRHKDGQMASWYLDEAFDRRGGSVGELHGELRLQLTVRAGRLFDGLWRKIMLTPVPPPLDEREKGFFQLPEATRRDLLDLYLNSFDAATTFKPVDSFDPNRAESEIVDLGNSRILMRARHLHTLFNPGLLQDQLPNFLQTGAMSLPSPSDGSPMPSCHAVAMHGVIHAYRCVEPETQTVMFVMAGEIFFRPIALFVPDGRLCVALDLNPIRGQMPELFREFFARIMQHGDLLAGYFAEPNIKPVHVWRGITAMHIGHVLWNDISGISQMMRRVPPDVLPTFRLFDAAMHPEMYGPLDVIFPELEGKIDRDPRSFQDGVPDFYRNRECPVRSSAMTVPRDVRERISAMLKPMSGSSPAAQCQQARKAGIPVILFGLRVENRTAVNLEAFCEALVDQLSASLGRCILVVDGHNSRPGDPDNFIWSHGELSAKTRPIDYERTLTEHMRDHSAGTRVTVIDTIGLPISESLACGQQAQALVAIWGAGLAKYRWVNNIPGLIVTNHHNLSQLGDLHLYDSPLAMELPTPVRFIDDSLVHDEPDAPLMVPLGPDFIPSICNFSIDEAGAMATVHAVLADLGLTDH
ncbi:hypothetical protein NFI95_02840 [Acetobacteraceae bacterium KSS8]|uniref:Uncharacterized protein n=1 Tax=Endosaccharibacter trunci TaxID=2812733 RepID=A0ABT1W3E6_9PROT|nr:hypothetical protein [Acetobacteraceae bacterium KSS8]